jgi:hypothetical protein
MIDQDFQDGGIYGILRMFSFCNSTRLFYFSILLLSELGFIGLMDLQDFVDV